MGSTASTPRPDNWIEAPEVPDVPIHELIFRRIEENLQKYGDGVWLTMSDTQHEIKFSEVIPKVKAVASALTKKGFRKGDLVTFFATNKVDYFVVVIAVWMCGGAVSLISNEALTGTLVSTINNANAVFIMCDEESIGQTLEAKKLTHTVQCVISLDAIIGETEHCISVCEMYRDDATACPSDVQFDSRNDIAYMPYSSGTTGLPKGIMHTFRTLTIMFYYITRPPIPNVKYQLRSCNFHIGGLVGYLGALLMHLPTISMERYDDEGFFRTIEKEKPTVVYLYVSQIVRIMKHLDLSKYDFSSVVVLGVTGSGIHPDWEDALRKRLPNLKRVVQGYGLTETFIITGLDFLKPTGMNKKGTLGKVLSFVELEIRDPETQQPLPIGQTGEFWVKTAMMMKGYWKNPEATAAFLVDGWHRTGDLGHIDEDGYVFFKERLKELIEVDGYQVFPQLMESILHLHPAVADVAVVGKPDELYGKVPVAFIVKKDGVETTKEDIANFINSRVSQSEQVRGGIVFIDSIPRNHMFKIIRRKLLENLNDTGDFISLVKN